MFGALYYKVAEKGILRPELQKRSEPQKAPAQGLSPAGKAAMNPEEVPAPPKAHAEQPRTS